jgi:hypothetical protein
MPKSIPPTQRLVFACKAAPGSSETEALILARSIRVFAGRFSDNPVWVCIPETEESISEVIRERLHSLNVKLVPFRIDPAASGFPFAGKVFAAAAAESLANGETETLAWMDSDSIVISDPKKLLLGDEKNLGCRPVDHTLIGSPYDRPIDSFWELIYRSCNVPAGQVFPMTASVDQQRIRPYFNAGLLVVRPQRGLLQLWRDAFHKFYRDTRFEEFYQQSRLYRIFIHQAILAGTILSTVDYQEIQQLSHLINYPLHMHTEYPADRRPAYMNELITCRYDVFFEDPGWRRAFPVKEPLKGWLDEQLSIANGSQSWG